MGRLDVREIDDSILVRLDEMARKRKLSRSDFVRKVLTDMALFGEIRAVEDKYENLVLLVAETVEQSREELRELKETIERFIIHEKNF